MTNVTVYDPAMCCSTGICGAEVGQQLVTFAADLDWPKWRASHTRLKLEIQFRRPAQAGAAGAAKTPKNPPPAVAEPGLPI